jgi:D-sedoheptulose 7-phosphate isomerase
MDKSFHRYARLLTEVIGKQSWSNVEKLSEALYEAWQNRNQIFLCGNGGSAANAIHIANDFLYGVSSGLPSHGMKVEALSSNPAVLTCLANDVNYAAIYSEQLFAKAEVDDLLIVLSGSGNSPNVVQALEAANRIGMKTFAILGFSGGRCRELAQTPIHFKINDMQISEDLQLIVGHMCMQWLSVKSKQTAT